MSTIEQLLDDIGDSYVVITIMRQSVEERYTAGVVAQLMALTDTPERVRAYREKVAVYVEGYDDDPRDLAEVPEVCEFFRDVTQQWPYWLWFLIRELDQVRCLISYLAGAKRYQNAAGKTEFVVELNDVRRVLSQLVRGSETFFQVHGITESEQMDSINSAIANLGL